MVQDRTVAILALNNGMGRLHDALILVTMAVFAVLAVELIFHQEMLPPFFTILIVETIHVSSLPDTEILWDIKYPDNQYEDNQGDHYKKGSPDVTLHRFSSPAYY